MQDDILSTKGPVRLGYITLAALVLGFGGWALLTEISGAVVASGQVEVENNRQIVQHPDGGVVAEILVTEAQSVQAGDVLIRLDGAFLYSELSIVEGQLYEAMARRARLEAERDERADPVFPEELLAAAAANPEVMELLEGQRKLFYSRRETLTKQTQQLQKRIAQIASQNQGNDAQLAANLVRVLTEERDALRARLAALDQRPPPAGGRSPADPRPRGSARG